MLFPFLLNLPFKIKKKARQGRASSQTETSHISDGGTDIDKSAGDDGEGVIWEESHEVYNDDALKLLDVDKDIEDDDIEPYITEAANLLGFERTHRLKIQAVPLDKCKVPTPPQQLTNKVIRFEGFQYKNELVTADQDTTFVVLEPISKEAPSIIINTLAQEFIRNPAKQWHNDSSLQLCTAIPYNHNLLLWARMMLISEEDKEMLLKADIFHGVLASLYHVPINPSLLADFLTFWNTDGHTLITSQGEMGYPLIAMYDAMGIPISGHLYEEYFPLPSEVSEIVKVLHSAYADIWVLADIASEWKLL